MSEKRKLIEPEHKNISIQRQCELVGLSRSSYYYEPRPESAQNLALMRLMDAQFMKTPFYGVRRMHQYLLGFGYSANVKRIRRLYRLMGLEAIYPKPRPKPDGAAHKVYPYLLKDYKVTAPNQVWSSDITYIPMPRGFLYLVAVIDWFSRYVLAWRVSNSLDAAFCIEALTCALAHYGVPVIFNTDQGVQFTSKDYTDILDGRDIQISMDGRGRAFDNIFIERLWRSVKYEYVYLNAPENGQELHTGLQWYFDFFNNERPHQSLENQTPFQVYSKMA
jgi:putative transposase